MQKLLIRFFFADGHDLVATGKFHLLTGPTPMARLHDLFGRIRMALETRPGDRRGRRSGAPESSDCDWLV